MKKYRIDIYQTVNYLYEEFATEADARAFGSKLRTEMAKNAGKDWMEFHFGLEEVKSNNE